jgi:hypothetical protein
MEIRMAVVYRLRRKEILREHVKYCSLILRVIRGCHQKGDLKRRLTQLVKEMKREGE